MTRTSGSRRRLDVARWLLGGLLLAMAGGQLADPAGFIDIVTTYRLGGEGVSEVVAGALIAGELTAGVGLFARNAASRRAAATIAVLVATGWTVVTLQAFARGLSIPNCGCFGVYAGQSLRWWVLIEDLEFVALAVWVRVRVGRRVAGAELAQARNEGR